MIRRLRAYIAADRTGLQAHIACLLAGKDTSPELAAARDEADAVDAALPWWLDRFAGWCSWQVNKQLYRWSWDLEDDSARSIDGGAL